MIVDSSAILAIIMNEPDGPRLAKAMRTKPGRVSAATLVEAGIVADSRSRQLGAELDALVDLMGLEVVPLTAKQAAIARHAHRRYGRGSGSPAKLNFGDCLAYALAVDLGEELLFKGEDFTHTDILPAL